MTRSPFTALAALAVVALLPALGMAQTSDIPKPSRPSASSDEYPELKEARELFSKGDFDGALKKLESAVKAHPGLGSAEEMFAKFLFEIKQPQGGYQSLQVAVTKAPTDPEAYIDLGEVDFGNRQVAEADLLFRKAADLLATANLPEKRKAALNKRHLAGLARVAEARQDWAGELKLLDKLLAEEPSNFEWLQLRGRAQFQLKDYDKALESLKKARTANMKAIAEFRENSKDYDPANPPLPLLPGEAVMAQFYMQSGSLDKVFTPLLDAVKVDDRDPRIRVLAAQYYLMSSANDPRKLKSAQAQAKQAMDLAEDSKSDALRFDAFMAKGAVGLFMKEYKEAEEACLKAHEIYPKRFEAMNNLALALCHQQGATAIRKGLEYAQTNAQENQQNAEAVTTLGRALYCAKQYGAAEEQLRRVVASPNASADARYFYAQVLFDANKESTKKLPEVAEVARKNLEMALKASENQPFIWKADAQRLLEEVKKDTAKSGK